MLFLMPTRYGKSWKLFRRYSVVGILLHADEKQLYNGEIKHKDNRGMGAM